jgi:glutamine synthetase
MRKATNAITAMPGTIHGSTLLAPGAVATPTDAPQSWQNRAPGVSAWPHETQFAPASAAPQFAQKRPLAGALQRGQGVEGSEWLMTGKLSDTGHPTGWRHARDLPPVQPGPDISCLQGARTAPDPLREVCVAGQSRSLLADLTGATKKDILKLTEAHGVRFLRLTFTDILGVNKNVEIPSSQFSKALDGDIMFDGSSIEGFVRIEESDMLLSPDLSTFKVFPGGDTQSRVGRLICDITMPDGAPFDGDPRAVLRRQVARAAKLGYTMNAGMEAEFFLFRPAPDGGPATTTHDVGGYFDLAPMDLGEEARRAIVDVLEQMGFEVEAAHHEVAHGQHEIDFRYADAMTTADNIATFRFVVKHVAQQFGLVASFMPKPVFGQNGSGMHTHQSLFRDGRNAFFDPKGEFELSRIAHQYISGLLTHARGMCAITNPLVNSYKRLVPGYEAPVNVAWSMRNRSPLIRVPARRGTGTRVELRSPDPSANPYLALAVMLAAGMDGVVTKSASREPVETNIWEMSHREKRRLRIDDLPHDLNEACDELERDEVITGALGAHVSSNFLAAKRQEWLEYITQVSAWELEHYLAKY